MPDDRNDPRNTFSGSAGRYLVSTDHSSGPDLKIIRRAASQQFPAVVVDVGTGAGHAMRAASPFSGTCIALDLTMEMLQTARDHFTGAVLENARFIQSAADRLPLADNTVSLLTCRIAPHHFPSIPDFLDEVVRVLEPQGRAIIVDSIVPDDAAAARFINDVEKLRDPSHVRSHTLRSWLAYFETADLETISVELFERTHPFREWVMRTGLDEDGVNAVEKRFKTAPPEIRGHFKMKRDDGGGLSSYTDEKGIFVLKKGNG